MTILPRRLRPALALPAAAVVMLAACTGSGASPTAADGGVEGFVSIHGSSTVEPITSLVAETFSDANPGFDYEVGGEGTGAGFEEFFCLGDADISDASRAINDEEAALCEENGVAYTELQVAFDGLSVVTSTENSDVTCLSFLDLYALLGPESEGFANWSDANDLAEELAGELGTEFGESHAPYPDASLDVTAPGEESGTFDSFVDIVLGDIAEARGQDATTRPDYTASPNDNVIVEGIAGSPSSLGWVGLAFAEQNTETITALEIDGGDGCVAPTTETVADGSYAISRPLFIYVSHASADENPAVAAFVDYYLSDDGIAAVADAGYVELPEDPLQATRDAWEGR